MTFTLARLGGSKSTTVAATLAVLMAACSTSEPNPTAASSTANNAVEATTTATGSSSKAEGRPTSDAPSEDPSGGAAGGTTSVITAPVLAAAEAGQSEPQFDRRELVAAPRFLWRSQPAPFLCSFATEGPRGRCERIEEGVSARGWIAGTLPTFTDVPPIYFVVPKSASSATGDLYTNGGIGLAVAVPNQGFVQRGPIYSVLTSKSHFTSARSAALLANGYPVPLPANEQHLIVGPNLLSYRHAEPHVVSARRIDSDGNPLPAERIGAVDYTGGLYVCLAEDGTAAALFASRTKAALAGALLLDAKGWVQVDTAKLEGFHGASPRISCGDGKASLAKVRRPGVDLVQCSRERCALEVNERVQIDPQAQVVANGPKILVVERKDGNVTLRHASLAELHQARPTAIACQGATGGATGSGSDAITDVFPTTRGAVVVLGGVRDAKLCAFFVERGGTILPVTSVKP